MNNSATGATGNDSATLTAENTITANPLIAGLTIELDEIDAAGIYASEENDDFAARSTNLQLIGFNDSHEVVHKYWEGGHLVPYDGEDNKADFAVFKVSVQTNDIVDDHGTVLQTAEEVANTLKNKTLGLSTDASGHYAGYFLAVGVAAPTSVTDDSTNYITTYSVGTTMLNTETQIGWLVVYLKGNISATDTETQNTEQISGSLTATVSWGSL